MLGRMASQVENPELRPNVSLHNQPFSQYVEHILADEWESVADMLLESARSLHNAGATFCILPDNVTHHVMPIVASKSPVPILNMVEIAAAHIEHEGYSQVGLIGTKFVTFGSTYQTILGMQGVKVRVPTEEEATGIDSIIFKEAVFGSVTDASCTTVAGVIGSLKSTGCEAVILGASEASLILRDKDLPLPLIDPVELLSKVAIHRCKQHPHSPSTQN